MADVLMTHQQHNSDNGRDTSTRRRRVLRTAWIIAGVAITVYIAFVAAAVIQAQT